MSDTYSYEVLEPGGHARLVGNVLDRISRASANPASAVGSSRAMLGDPETASWMERNTAADGAALIESICGNTIVESGSLLPVRMEGIETVAADESWSSQLAIPAATYFPQGLRSAGTVRDELTATEAITRVGAVDLGSLTWSTATSEDVTYFYGDFSSLPAGTPLPKLPSSTSETADVTCALYTTRPTGAVVANDKSISLASNASRIFAHDSAYTDAATFKAAMSGVMLHYALATPTTQPIDPPLLLSYRTDAGGTERVMVAAGTTSAPPVFATRYPLDPADLAASIAPRESATAEANHAVGDLLMLGFTLCKVTTAIARGEAITIGTNVTRTSVAAEIAALS